MKKNRVKTEVRKITPGSTDQSNSGGMNSKMDGNADLAARENQRKETSGLWVLLFFVSMIIGLFIIGWISR